VVVTSPSYSLSHTAHSAPGHHCGFLVAHSTLRCCGAGVGWVTVQLIGTVTTGAGGGGARGALSALGGAWARLPVTPPAPHELHQVLGELFPSAAAAGVAALVVAALHAVHAACAARPCAVDGAAQAAGDGDESAMEMMLQEEQMPPPSPGVEGVRVSGGQQNTHGVIRLGRSLTLRDALRVCRRVSCLCDDAAATTLLTPALRDAVMREASDCLLGGVAAGAARSRLLLAVAGACGVSADRAVFYDTLHKPVVRSLYAHPGIGFQQSGCGGAERCHRTCRERMGSPALQTLQEPILGLLSVAAFLTRFANYPSA
jgi:hypothetical protein